MNRSMQWAAVAAVTALIAITIIINSNHNQSPTPVATATPAATVTKVVPTVTPMPTKTLVPSPTNTPIPSPTALLTATPEPQLPKLPATLRSSVTCLAVANHDASQCLNTPASTYVLVVQLWQQDRFASEVITDSAITLDPSFAQDFIDAAHAQGSTVVLKPLVNLYDQTAGGSFGWRGNIALNAEGKAKWFQSYEEALLAYVNPLRGLDGIVIGTEFSSLQGEDAQWRRIVKSVRRILPTGAFVSYNANWYGLLQTKDGVADITWWDSVDSIGVSAYFPLCTELEAPTVHDLIDCWKPLKADLLGYGNKHDKPIWLAEVGIVPQNGAHKTPWDNTRGAPFCPECQQNFFNAVIETWRDAPMNQFTGITWWAVDTQVPSEETTHAGFYLPSSPGYDIVVSYLTSETEKATQPTPTSNNR